MSAYEAGLDPQAPEQGLDADSASRDVVARPVGGHEAQVEAAEASSGDAMAVHEVYGALKESAHFSSYGFERLCDRLDWVLQEDRWRQLGHDDINRFLGTIDLSSLNLGSKRPKLVQRIKELQPEASQRQIARTVGASEMTVRRDLGATNVAPDSSKSLKSKEGKTDCATNDARQWLDQPASETTEKARKADDSPTAPHVTRNTGENRWYTPAEHVARVRAVLGEIDLDPASCQEANKVVGAKRYYSIEDDGLRQEWSGNIYANPPYDERLVKQFIEKLLDSPRVTQAIVLTNNNTETDAAQALMQAATAICFPDGRVKYWGPRGGGSPLQGQMFCYLGPHPEVFAKHFRKIGRVWQDRAITISRQAPEAGRD